MIFSFGNCTHTNASCRLSPLFFFCYPRYVFFKQSKTKKNKQKIQNTSGFPLTKGFGCPYNKLNDSNSSKRKSFQTITFLFVCVFVLFLLCVSWVKKKVGNKPRMTWRLHGKTKRDTFSLSIAFCSFFESESQRGCSTCIHIVLLYFCV